MKKGKNLRFRKPLEMEKEDENGNKQKQDVSHPKILPCSILKYCHVLHIDPCEGVKLRFVQETFVPVNPITNAEAILSDYSQRSGCHIINKKQGRAYPEI